VVFDGHWLLLLETVERGHCTPSRTLVHDEEVAVAEVLDTR